MDRERFEYLLEAYGADFARWPAEERAAGEVYAAQNPEATASALRDAKSVDRALDQARPLPDTASLAARILATAPKARRAVFDRRAALALAACAVFGVLLGYGGGLLTPLADDDDGYFADAFAAPFGDEG
jgi:hypothetical protein